MAVTGIDALSNADDVEAEYDAVEQADEDAANAALEHYANMALITELMGATMSGLQVESNIFKKANDAVGQLSV